MDAAGWSDVVAGVALAVSLFAYFAGRWRDRRDLFLRVHERLAAADLQEGRRLIHELLRDQQRKVGELEPRQRDLINYTLSNLNVACFYYRRRYVRRKDMKEMWGRPLVDAFNSAGPFLEFRDRENGGVPIWPDLRAFVEDARKHQQAQLPKVAPAPSPPGAVTPPL